MDRRGFNVSRRIVEGLTFNVSRWIVEGLMSASKPYLLNNEILRQIFGRAVVLVRSATPLALLKRGRCQIFVNICKYLCFGAPLLTSIARSRALKK
eukprot:1006060-Prorocentrum_minimum.AAC.1